MSGTPAPLQILPSKLSTAPTQPRPQIRTAKAVTARKSRKKATSYAEATLAESQQVYYHTSTGANTLSYVPFFR